jgi:putative ABC transport system permease protein
MAIEVRDGQDDVAAIRSIMTSVGLLVALGIAAMTVGLIRSESVRDLRTLTATGASPRARRAITASTTGALATLGVVLGMAAAYAALVGAYHSQLDKLTPLPLLQLVMLGVGLPFAATAAGWLVAGREPKSFARQTLD